MKDFEYLEEKKEEKKSKPKKDVPRLVKRKGSTVSVWRTEAQMKASGGDWVDG